MIRTNYYIFMTLIRPSYISVSYLMKSLCQVAMNMLFENLLKKSKQYLKYSGHWDANKHINNHRLADYRLDPLLRGKDCIKSNITIIACPKMPRKKCYFWEKKYLFPCPNKMYGERIRLSPNFPLNFMILCYLIRERIRFASCRLWLYIFVNHILT